MSRRKKKSQQERRQQEKARRLEAAGKPKEKTQPAQKQARKEKPKETPAEKQDRPVVTEAAAPAQQPEAGRRREKARTKRPSAPAPMAVSNSRYKTLDFGEGRDAGRDCSRYDVRFPARMDIQALFDAIRRERRDERGVVYISTNLAEAGTSNYQLSYDYAGGMFTRREKPSEDRKAPLLADLLGMPVRRLSACGGWGVMDYFVNIAAGAGTDAAPYDPSEIIPGTSGQQ